MYCHSNGFSFSKCRSVYMTGMLVNCLLAYLFILYDIFIKMFELFVRLEHVELASTVSQLSSLLNCSEFVFLHNKHSHVPCKGIHSYLMCILWLILQLMTLRLTS